MLTFLFAGNYSTENDTIYNLFFFFFIIMWLQRRRQFGPGFNGYCMDYHEIGFRQLSALWGEE